ncbi:MBL fold metallo-hydrolase [Streptomyces sp. NBC_01429]|uniref:MBL fold metallo-hydrolase n=1 Tax=Streptomyces sp. NBC_01429 TaxID=2903862 RepID=UPI002E2BA42A|nr:MBL fold metallo-hydrolase [Streptomyces sp. NBC_01429]
MRIRRLGWAGLEIEHAGQYLLIDAVQNNSPLFSDEPFPLPSAPGGTAAALVTHLHLDHADPVTIGAALAEGAPVFRPEPARGTDHDRTWTAEAEALFIERGIRTHVLRLWEEQRVGPFHIIAGPAIDGLGCPQCCWIVECDGVRVIHAGDTLFHGYWWSIANRVGPIDFAFLPINGAVVDVPHLQPPSPLNASMTPEQAAVAAHILGARTAVPIHYGSIHKPPVYRETPRAVARFVEQCDELGVTSSVRANGDWFTSSDSPLPPQVLQRP